jgi:hypothetical protein
VAFSSGDQDAAAVRIEVWPLIAATAASDAAAIRGTLIRPITRLLWIMMDPWSAGRRRPASLPRGYADSGR